MLGVDGLGLSRKRDRLILFVNRVIPAHDQLRLTGPRRLAEKCPRKHPETDVSKKESRHGFSYTSPVTETPTALVLKQDEALEPFPAAIGGLLVGYGRVSTRNQNLDRQIRALTKCGCAKIFTDKLSGKNTDRPEPIECLKYLREGDTLVVPSLDRLARSLQDLITITVDLRKRSIGFKSLRENLDTTTPGGRLVFHVFAALAEFIRELIIENTRDGVAAAKARGQQLGRPRAMTDEQISHAIALLAQPKASAKAIATLLGVSRSTLYAHVPQLAAIRGRREEGLRRRAAHPASGDHPRYRTLVAAVRLHPGLQRRLRLAAHPPALPRQPRPPDPRRELSGSIRPTPARHPRRPGRRRRGHQRPHRNQRRRLGRRPRRHRRALLDRLPAATGGCDAAHVTGGRAVPPRSMHKR